MGVVITRKLLFICSFINIGNIFRSVAPQAFCRSVSAVMKSSGFVESSFPRNFSISTNLSSQTCLLIQKLKEKAGNGLFIALLLFVGIPVPGTGAWTGTLAASFLDMGFKKSVLAVLGGVLLAGIVMGAASAGLFSALFAVF